MKEEKESNQKKEVNHLDKLNHVVRNQVLVIEAALLKIRQSVIEYEKDRLEKGGEPE